MLSNLMVNAGSRDDVLRLASTALPSMGDFRLYGIYLAATDSDGALTHTQWTGPMAPIVELDALAGTDAALNIQGQNWAWATAMHSLGGHQGYFVVSAERPPPSSQRFLLGVLAQQIATALATVAQTERLLAADAARTQAADRLEATVAELRRRTRAHELMTEAAVHGDSISGLATIAYRLTDLPTAICDQFGRVQASGGSAEVRWDGMAPTIEGALGRAASAGRAVRNDELIVSAVRPGREVLGGVVMYDPQKQAAEFEVYILEQAATMLTGEFAHQRTLAEVELRLRRELVTELVDGADDKDAAARAAALGYDLRQPHRVVAIKTGTDDDDWVEVALRRTTPPGEHPPLVGRRRGLLLALLPAAVDASDVHDRLKRLRGDVVSSVGVGAEVVGAAEMPRSYAQALRALHVRQHSPAPDGGTNFSALGLYQILEDPAAGSNVKAFVRRWLGSLIDYDKARHGDLVNTVAEFLDCGGNYDQTAALLMIHRSTLRYRLRRIRDIGQLDLGDVETRLNVHVATRAWRLLGVD
ncbi:MAG TPA: helix-turn-helix domain-containing protein [Jatrophihabitans sp.]|nr:helix-turn-helix domain-containing protein [Jatrophihabitans sp.]